MIEVHVRAKEPVDAALRRLKERVESEGLMDEVRRLRAFETPRDRVKRKAKDNARRNRHSRNAKHKHHNGD